MTISSHCRFLISKHFEWYAFCSKFKVGNDYEPQHNLVLDAIYFAKPIVITLSSSNISVNNQLGNILANLQPLAIREYIAKKMNKCYKMFSFRVVMAFHRQKSCPLTSATRFLDIVQLF